MCDRSICARDLADGFARQETRFESASKVRVDTCTHFDSDCTRSLVQTLVEYLDHDNALTRRQAWNSLQVLAEEHPLVVGDCTYEISEAVSPDDETAVERLGQVVSPLLSAGVDVSPSLSSDVLDALRRADPEACRLAAVTMYGKRGTYADFKMLVRMREYEVDTVADRIDRSIDEVLDAAIARVGDGSEKFDRDAETASLLRHAAFNYTDRLAERSDELFDLLGTEHGDLAIVALAALAELSHSTGPDVATRLERELRVSTADADDYPSTTDIDEWSQDQLKRAEDALSCLLRADLADQCADTVVTQVDDWLASDSVELHEHALTQLRTLSTHAPAAIEDHLSEIAAIAERDDREGHIAAEVLARHGRAQSDDPPSYLQEVLTPREETSAVVHLADTIGALKYRARGGTSFKPIEIDPATAQALSNVADAAQNNRTLPMVWPAYDPEIVVMLALEIALGGLPAGDDVVVFSPGGKNHWGDKSDLRKEFANYGLSVSDDDRVLPLEDIISHARIDDDGAVVSMSEGTAETSVVFSKRLSEVERLASPDNVVFNLTARTQAGVEDEIDELLAEYDDVSSLPVYTGFTKHEFEERRAPRYGPPRELGETDTLPGVDAFETAKEIDFAFERTDSATPGRFAPTFQRAERAHEIRVVAVDDAGLLKHLEKGYEVSSKMRKFDEARAAGRVFSRQLMFERLPFPTDWYDDWARSQRDSYFGPRTITSLVDRLRERGDDLLDNPAVAKNLFDVADHLKRALDHLADDNRMYDELVERIEQSLDDSETVAVFVPKSTWARAVRDILLEDGIVTQHDLETGRVTVVDPDSARGLEEHDRLLVIGPQRPQFAGFYVHPSVDETVVLTYQGEWDWMVERDATRFVDLMNEAAPGVDYEPYSLPDITVDTEAVDSDRSDIATEAVEATDESTAAPSASSPKPRSTDATARTETDPSPDRREIAELFDQSQPVDYGGSGNERYDNSQRREFEIETADGTTFVRRDRVLRRRPDPDADQGRYHWMSPANLREESNRHDGDQIAVVDDDVFQQLWDDWLSDVYAEELGETSTFEDLEDWHATLTEILESAATELDVDEITHPPVQQWVTSRAGSIDREPATVWRWFESVAAADQSLDLARNPSLTIGPRRAKDIAALGQIFGRESLTEERARQIEESMTRIRGVNSREGHEFRTHLKEQMNHLESTDIQEHSTVYRVVSVTEL
jgi:hypothetical protein